MKNHRFSFCSLKQMPFVGLAFFILSVATVAKAETTIPLQSTQYQPIAMVNDSPITPVDIDKRIHFLRIINNIPKSVTVTQTDKNKILNDLIDEKIKLQETTRFKIVIEDSRVNTAFKSTATNLNFSEKQLSDKLAKVGIDRLYFDAVTGNKMAWDELVQGRYGRDITVSTYEISQIIEANALTENLSIAFNQIVIPLEDTTAETQAKIQKTLDDISQRLKSGEAFINIAKAFNPDIATQTKTLSQIPSEIAGQLLTLQSEQIMPPVKVGNSVIIAQFLEKQKGDTSVIEQKMTIKSGRLEYDSDATPQEKQQTLQELNGINDLCEEYEDYLEDVRVFDTVTIAELPESLRAVAKNTPQGTTRIVRQAKDSDYVLTVCHIKKPDYYNDVSEEIRNKTRNQIFNHKLTLKEQDYYRDLRKYAVVTVFQ